MREGLKRRAGTEARVSILIRDFMGKPPRAKGFDSGIRLGTPAGTTRGFGIAEFRQVGDMIVEVLDVLSQKGTDEDSLVEGAVRDKVKTLISRFPVYQD